VKGVKPAFVAIYKEISRDCFAIFLQFLQKEATEIYIRKLYLKSGQFELHFIPIKTIAQECLSPKSSPIQVEFDLELIRVFVFFGLFNFYESN